MKLLTVCTCILNVFFLFCLFTNFCKPLIPESGPGRYINNNNNNNNNTWNNLPRTVVEAESINSFKNRLDDAWKDHQLKHSYRVTTNTAKQAVQRGCKPANLYT